MKTGWVRRIEKAVLVIVIGIGSLLLLMFLLPYIMPETISKEIKKLVNRSIDGKVEFSKARLSFFNHFPSLTLTLYDFSSTGSAPYHNEMLLSACELALGIRIPALIRGDIHVNEFFLSEANINVLVNDKGDANYNVYKAPGKKTTDSTAADTTTALKIEKIVISNSNLVYDDKASGILIHAKKLDYTGKGDLTKAIFDLASHLTIDTFDLYYAKEPYIYRKRINADLITLINTSSLAFEFTKNKLNINRLPIEMTGKYEFLSRGTNMNFELTSKKANLDDVFSVIPNSYQGWLKKTRIKGTSDISAKLAGHYIAGTDTMPDLEFAMNVRNGYIAYDKAPASLQNLYLDFTSELPRLNPDSLSINVDSVFFNVGKDHFSSTLHIKGYEVPYVRARVSSEMDLAKLDRALGLQDYDMRGLLFLRLDLDGRYTTGPDNRSLRKSIVVTGIPSFKLHCRVSNGYLHFTELPQPIQHINFNINAGCPDHDYHNIYANIENIDLKAMQSDITGFVRFKNARDFPVDADLNAIVALSEIRKFYPLDSLSVDGNLEMKIQSKGNYLPAKRIFPKTTASLKVNNASLKTKYYPAALEKIVVDATVENKEGTMRDLKVDIQPVSFEFEGKPFMVKADLQDFDNIRYEIVSKGEVDLGKVYRVFSQEGWDLQGTINTDLSLDGSQADAEAGRYSSLRNSGTIKVNSLIVYSELYPLPFIIDKGIFRFNQDHIEFEQLRTKYGKSAVVLNGYFSNLFAYTTGTGPMKGDVHLQSPYLLLDELMVYHTGTDSSGDTSTSGSGRGVIMVPKDLDLKLTTDVKAVDFNNLKIKSVKGEVVIRDSAIALNETVFELADAVTTMNATYKSPSTDSAQFTYHIKMDEFDVKKMYNEVELFRQLVPAAANAQGIISLDYKLDGNIDESMYPVMRSLKGGGVLSVKNVKMKGFKFFSAMSKETGKEGINDPDISKIKLNTTISNNVVTLEKTKIKVAGFRLRILGQTSFDGRLKFNCRVGLPPFGIIGIPVKVTGTGMNPKIQVGKTDNLPLEEQEEEMKDADSVNMHK